MGGLTKRPIGWIIPQVKGGFLGGPSLIHVNNMKWMGVRLMCMGFMTYRGLYCLLYGCLWRGCVAPSFSMHPFSKPIYFLFFLRCFQVEAKVGLLPKHEKHHPPWLYPGHIMVPEVEDNVWDFYLSMKNIAHTRSTLVGIFILLFFVLLF